MALFKAFEMGFINNRRVRAGEEFELDVSALKKREDGSPILPKWAVPMGETSGPSDETAAAVRNLYSAQQRASMDKFAAAAIASSGTAGAKAKSKSFEEAMRSGPNRDSRAEAAALAASGTAGAKVKKAAFEEVRDAGRGPLEPLK